MVAMGSHKVQVLENNNGYAIAPIQPSKIKDVCMHRCKYHPSENPGRRKLYTAGKLPPAEAIRTLTSECPKAALKKLFMMGSASNLSSNDCKRARTQTGWYGGGSPGVPAASNL